MWHDSTEPILVSLFLGCHHRQPGKTHGLSTDSFSTCHTSCWDNKTLRNVWFFSIASKTTSLRNARKISHVGISNSLTLVTESNPDLLWKDINSAQGEQLLQRNANPCLERWDVFLSCSLVEIRVTLASLVVEVNQLCWCSLKVLGYLQQHCNHYYDHHLNWRNDVL